MIVISTPLDDSAIDFFESMEVFCQKNVLFENTCAIWSGLDLATKHFDAVLGKKVNKAGYKFKLGYA